MLGAPGKTDWLLGGRDHAADCVRGALKDKWIRAVSG